MENTIGAPFQYNFRSIDGDVVSGSGVDEAELGRSWHEKRAGRTPSI